MKPTQKILDVLHILRSMGIRIALDDFGTGYSSLNYLQKLPVDILKIDKTFIDSIESDSVKLKMVGNIVKMAHDMNYRVVAEGVEHMQQVSLLDNYRCDYIQGYIWGKPLQLNEMNAVMAEYCKSKKK
jgi:EAL domain-containing protein (putative c-di-GMP-specific phosphodiesterase class I)